MRNRCTLPPWPGNIGACGGLLTLLDLLADLPLGLDIMSCRFASLTRLFLAVLLVAVVSPAASWAHDLEPVAALGLESATLAGPELALPAIESSESDDAEDTSVNATAALAHSRHVQPCPQLKTYCQQFRVREQDKVWVVSSRHLGCNAKITADSLQALVYDKGTWQPKPMAEFYATDSADVVTTTYIHGNRIDAGLARADGLAVYFQLVGKYDHQRAVRFVIYSWPSDQIKGPLVDVRTKAARADQEAFYLAKFVSKIDKDVPLGLVGYSYGARIILGGMHLLGGGSFGGRSVEPSQGQAIRVALWAAAEHNHWPLPGHAHGQALGMADQWLITINCCDPALRRYAAVDPCSKPTALGFAGFAGGLPSDLAARTRMMNVSNIVGGAHDMHLYLYSPSIAQPTAKTVLWYAE